MTGDTITFIQAMKMMLVMLPFLCVFAFIMVIIEEELKQWSARRAEFRRTNRTWTRAWKSQHSLKAKIKRFLKGGTKSETQVEHIT